MMRTIISVILSFVLMSCQKDGRYCRTLDSGPGLLICEDYAKGRLVKIQQYKNDTTWESGPFVTFSPNGDTLTKGYYRNHKLIGGYYENYSNNKPKTYVCFDSFNQDTIFFRQYSKEGKIINEKGILFPGSGYKSNRITEDTTINLWTVIVNPPLCKVRTNGFLTRVGSGDTILPLKQYFEPYQNDLLLTTEFKVIEKGMYNIYLHQQLYDQLQDSTYEYDEFFEFER